MVATAASRASALALLSARDRLWVLVQVTCSYIVLEAGDLLAEATGAATTLANASALQKTKLLQVLAVLWRVRFEYYSAMRQVPL